MISHRDLVETETRFEAALFRELGRHVDLEFADWDEGGRTQAVRRYATLVDHDIRDFDACVVFVRFRLRMKGPPLDWDGFDGLRIWLEPDAWGGFFEKSPYFGQYEPVYRRDRFDLMVSSGREVTRRLNDAGVKAYWVPKGYDESVFHDMGGERHGVCTFGTPWPSRRALVHHLSRAGLAVADVSGPYVSLNQRLNRYAGGLVCNMPASVPLGRLGRAVNHRFPEFVLVAPGIEPMAKAFEVAGAGCAPIIDAMDELDALGFVTGQTCMTYQDFEEAVQLLRYTDDNELRTIGARAAEMSRAQHTWGRRAAQLAGLLEELLWPTG